MKVTQKMVADALGLSIITVSRALRGHPDLADSTKEKVLQKARELGYAKIKKTSGKQSSRPRRVGLYIFDVPGGGGEAFLVSGVKRSIFMSLQKQCQKYDIETLIETSYADEVPRYVRNGSIDAAFIFGRYNAQTISQFRTLPTLAVSSFVDCPGLPRIVADNFNGMKMVTEHLLDWGHKRILFLALKEKGTKLFEERSFGYIAAMHTRRLKPELKWIGSLNEAPDKDAIGNHTAVVCASDTLAYTLHGKLTAAGLRIPQDLSLAGFDNLDVSDSIPITTYSPKWDLMGKLAVDMLLSSPLNLSGQDIVITVSGELLVRSTTGRV